MDEQLNEQELDLVSGGVGETLVADAVIWAVVNWEVVKDVAKKAVKVAGELNR